MINISIMVTLVTSICVLVGFLHLFVFGQIVVIHYLV